MANIYFSLYLHVVLLVSLYYAANGENNITIIPTDGSYSACPEQTLHCRTFSQFMNNSNDSSGFNTSNSIVLFLPGEHKLRNHWSKHLIVRGVNNITWHGESAGRTVPTIHCEEDIGFMFADIANLTIRNLEFVNCGHQLPSVLSQSILDSRQRDHDGLYPINCEQCIFHLQNETWAAIAVANVDFVHMEHVTVKQSRGYGLFAINMLGRSSIDSCTFQDSNSQKFAVGEITRPKFVTPSKLVGGNAMIIFFDCKRPICIMTTNLSIRNSFFQNGSDNSEPNINQCNYIGNSKQLMRANGLAVITGQDDYQVHFILEKTTFTNNLGNYKFPSVLISDFSDLNILDTDNIFTITKCNFTNDGTFRLSLNILIIRRNLESNLVTLQVLECNFSDGIGTGIDIFMNYEGFFKNYHPRITIENCTYQGYKDTPSPTKRHSEESVVLVRYNCDYTFGECPNINIEIKGCTFHRNQIPSTTFFLGLRIHESYYSLLQPRMLITVKNCTYSKNKTPNKSTVTVIMLAKLNNERIWLQEYLENNEVIDMNHVIITNTLFVNNTSNLNGIVHIQNNLVTLDNCIFLKSKGTAVRANHSIITLEGTNEFSENTGQEGGGLSLIETRIRLMPNSTTTLFGNKADYGGGIFAIPVNYTRTEQSVEQLCTLILPTYNMTLLKKMNIKIKLENNTAHVAGDSIFNGAYDGCYSVSRGVDFPVTPIFVFVNENLLNVFDVKWRSQFEIASLPTKLCTCGRKSEQCIKTQVNVFPGEIFNISLVALGKLNGTTSVFVAGRTCLHYSNFSKCNHDYQSEIGHGGGEQPLSRVCTNISYSVNSPGDKVDLEIKIRNLIQITPLLGHYFNSESTSPMIVEVNLLPCPIGFELAVGTRNERFCKCVDYLTKAGIVCNINTAEILCPNHKWVGVHSTDPYSFIVHNNCPFDYCIAGEKHIDLSVPDEQCSYNRSGVLCGECQSNMSLVLGSSNCKQCSNIG